MHTAMNNEKQIDVILLDLGGVVFELDWEAPFTKLNISKERQSQIIEKVVHSNYFDGYERGNISTQDFKSYLEEVCHLDLSDEDFFEAWSTIVPRVLPGTDELLEKISTPLYALSNTCLVHYQHVTKTFSIMKRFKEVYTSFELGCRKPEPLIYEKVISKLKTDPKKILFIDDNAKNVEAAIKMGMQSRLCTSTKNSLFDILVSFTLTK